MVRFAQFIVDQIGIFISHVERIFHEECCLQSDMRRQLIQIPIISELACFFNDKIPVLRFESLELIGELLASIFLVDNMSHDNSLLFLEPLNENRCFSHGL